MIKQYETKSITGEIKGLDQKGRVVEMILASWNQDKHNDIITPGAFRKTISERGSEILFLNQHDWKQPHGFFAELKETPEGLYGRSNPLLDTTYSSDLLKLYEAGIIKEHSIGFTTVKWTYNEETAVRTITELKLYEGSNVTMAANSNTPLLGIKSLTAEEIDTQAGLILKCLREGNFTDTTFIQLEIALKQLQTQAYELGKSDKSTQPPQGTEPQRKDAELASVIHLFNSRF